MSWSGLSLHLSSALKIHAAERGVPIRELLVEYVVVYRIYHIGFKEETGSEWHLATVTSELIEQSALTPHQVDELICNKIMNAIDNIAESRGSYTSNNAEEYSTPLLLSWGNSPKLISNRKIYESIYKVNRLLNIPRG